MTPQTGSNGPPPVERGTGPGRADRARSAVAPLPRAVGFYARSWRRYLARPPAGGEVPIVRPTVALAGQAFLDEIVIGGFRMLGPSRPPHLLERTEREARAAIDLYSASGFFDQPERFFTAPPILTDVDIDTRPARARRLEYTRLSFESGYAPRPDEPGGGRWSAYPSNHQARAWLLRHPEPRPWLICVHGASMGRPAIDLSVFRARWLHHDLGLNVVLPVLPLHGPRRHDLPDGAGFPGEDVIDNVHGAAQSVWDVRRILSWIRETDPGSPVGITGISLGGYVSSLVASLEDGLSCAILGVPAVDLTDLIEHHAGLRHDDERQEVFALAKQLAPMVSPLSLTPRVPPEGRFIYAGLADRLVHPRHQVARLWEHWGRPEIEWYEGGHTGFFRSKPVGRFVLSALVGSGLVDPSLDRTSR